MYYILSAIVLWSSLGIAIRLSSMPVQILIFASNLISTVLIGLLFINKEFRATVPRGKAFFYLLIMGPISLINTFSFFYAYKTTSIANAVLTHYTAPVIVAFLAPVFLRERLTARVLVSVALATVGLWIMLGVSVPDFIRLVRAGDENTGGILSGLFSGFAYAVLIITFRVLAQNFHPLVMTFFQNSMIALLLLPFVRVTGTVAVSDFWIFAAMGIVHSTIAPVLYFKGLGLVTSNRAAILGYLEPVCAIMLGVVFLGEAVTFKTVIGGIMILFSGYLTIKDKQEVRRRK
ncbi:MAG: EamA family transporter [Nitrospirota bacterium]